MSRTRIVTCCLLLVLSSPALEAACLNQADTGERNWVALEDQVASRPLTTRIPCVTELIQLYFDAGDQERAGDWISYGLRRSDKGRDGREYARLLYFKLRLALDPATREIDLTELRAIAPEMAAEIEPGASPSAAADTDTQQAQPDQSGPKTAAPPPVATPPAPMTSPDQPQVSKLAVSPHPSSHTLPTSRRTGAAAPDCQRLSASLEQAYDSYRRGRLGDFLLEADAGLDGVDPQPCRARSEFERLYRSAGVAYFDASMKRAYALLKAKEPRQAKEAIDHLLLRGGFPMGDREYSYARRKRHLLSMIVAGDLDSPYLVELYDPRATEEGAYRYFDGEQAVIARMRREAASLSSTTE